MVVDVMFCLFCLPFLSDAPIYHNWRCAHSLALGQNRAPITVHRQSWELRADAEHRKNMFFFIVIIISFY